MSLLTYGRTRRHSPAPAPKWNAHATAARAIGMIASALREVWEIVLTMAGLLALLVASLTLDVWIWVPRLDH
jgi:hypothetical protein